MGDTTFLRAFPQRPQALCLHVEEGVVTGTLAQSDSLF